MKRGKKEQEEKKGEVPQLISTQNFNLINEEDSNCLVTPKNYENVLSKKDSDSKFISQEEGESTPKINLISISLSPSLTHTIPDEGKINSALKFCHIQYTIKRSFCRVRKLHDIKSKFPERTKKTSK